MLDVFFVLLKFYLVQDNLFGKRNLVALLKCLTSLTKENLEVLQNMVWTFPN